MAASNVALVPKLELEGVGADHDLRAADLIFLKNR
jgi:hypothetical protein